MSTCSRRPKSKHFPALISNASPFTTISSNRRKPLPNNKTTASNSSTATNATLQPASLATTRPPTPPAPAIRNIMTQAVLLRQRSVSRTETSCVQLVGGAASVRSVDHGIARDLPTSEYCIDLATFELVWPTFRFASNLPGTTSDTTFIGGSPHRHHHPNHRIVSTVNNAVVHYSQPFNDTFGTNSVYITSPRPESVDAYVLVAISKAVTRQYALDVDVILRYWTKVQRSPVFMTNTMVTNDGDILDRVSITQCTTMGSEGSGVEAVPRAWKLQRQRHSLRTNSNNQLSNIINDKKLLKSRWAAVFKLPEDCVESMRNLPGRPLSVMVQVQRRVLEYSGNKKVAGLSGRVIKPNGPFADLRLRVLYPFGIKKPMTPIEARIDTTVMAMRSESFRQKIEAKLVSMGQLERLTLSKLEFSSQHPHALTIRPSFLALPGANTAAHSQQRLPRPQIMSAVKGAGSAGSDQQLQRLTRSGGNSRDSFDSQHNNNLSEEAAAAAAARLYAGGGPRKRPRLDKNTRTTVTESPYSPTNSSSSDENVNADLVAVRSADSITAQSNNKIVRVNAQRGNNRNSRNEPLVITNSNKSLQDRCASDENDECTQQITFNYMSPEALGEFIRYIYEGLINPVCYDFLTTAQLYAASDKMHFDELKKPLLDRMCFLMEAGWPSDLFDAFSLAHELKVPTVQRHAEVLVEKYAKTVLHGQDWNEFKTDYPDLIAELVRALA